MGQHLLRSPAEVCIVSLRKHCQQHVPGCATFALGRSICPRLQQNYVSLLSYLLASGQCCIMTPLKKVQSNHKDTKTLSLSKTKLRFFNLNMRNT